MKPRVAHPETVSLKQKWGPQEHVFENLWKVLLQNLEWTNSPNKGAMNSIGVEKNLVRRRRERKVGTSGSERAANRKFEIEIGGKLENKQKLKFI